VTDIVLYGDTRPIHAQAVEIANKLGLSVHVFEEGYMRPYWVTYERGGTNGNSRCFEIVDIGISNRIGRSAFRQNFSFISNAC